MSRQSSPKAVRRLAAALLIGTSVTAGVLGLTGAASAADQQSGFGVGVQVGELASVQATVEPTDEPTDEATEDPCEQDPDFPGCETPSPDPSPTDPEPAPEPTETLPPAPQPTLPPVPDPTDEPTFPGGGGGDDGGDGDQTVPTGDADGPGDDASGDGPAEQGCGANALSCSDDVQAQDPSEQLPPAAPAAADDAEELPHTGGLDEVARLGLVGAGLIALGAVMATRHYRGRHRSRS